jgi:hypothetical protein
MRDGSNRVRKGGRIAAGLLSACLAGCVTHPDALPGPKPRAVLIAPTSVDQRLPEPLRAGVPLLQQMISQMLWAQDLRVDAPTLPEFAALWEEAERAAAVAGGLADGGAAPRRDVAVRELLDGLRARGERFDALLVPYLTVRPGVVTGQSVSWDGVTRRLPLEYRHRDVRFLVVRRRVEAPCTSLGVVAYDARGERLFERIGGLEVAKRMWVSDDGHRRRWEDREDLFQDQRALQSGVEVALEPLLRN